MMNQNPIGRRALALYCVLFAGVANAECLSTDDPSSTCRYPAGDAWCVRHGDGNLYAYRDGCADEKGRTEGRTTTRPPAATGSSSAVADRDCARARTVAEQLVCANPDIRAQDARMGALYGRLEAHDLAPERAQKAWLLDRRNACNDADCLRRVYAERIRELERMVGPEQPPARARETILTPPPPEAPGTWEPLPEPTPGSVAESTPGETPPLDVATTQDESTRRPETGIPELPPPEGPVWRPTPGPAADRAAEWGAGMLPVGLAVLSLVLGVFVWRRRDRIRAAVEPVIRPIVRLGQWMQSAGRIGLAGVRDRRERARPPAAVDAPLYHAPTPGLHLPDDLITRLRTLAAPGESISSVLVRAVAALEVESARRTSDPVQSRLAALEARLAQLEGASGRGGTSR
jgi:uncharacterized protein YecT (DUF1311 family)